MPGDRELLRQIGHLPRNGMPRKHRYTLFHRPSKDFRRAIEKAGLVDTVVPIVCRSEVAARLWSTPLSLVFIDGGHSYEAALTDYQCWTRHLLPGGYLLIHDIFDDPKKGGQAPYQVYRLAVESGLFLGLPMTGTLGVLQRIDG
jgi:hypothetical protein